MILFYNKFTAFRTRFNSFNISSVTMYVIMVKALSIWFLGVPSRGVEALKVYFLPRSEPLWL